MKHFAGLIAYAALVAGHGYVTNGTIGGSSYEFYQPYTDPYTSPTPERVSRPIQGNGPVTVVTYNDIQCGGDTANGVDGSSPANLTADVTAGSDVNLYWTLWPSSHVGPTITYMAKCDNDDCTTFMPGTDSVWFKVQEDGRDGTSDTWGATALMTAGGYVTYTVPECIESGAYLVRHEIIALHSAGTEGGAQFYPGCHQINVSGGGSTTPSDLVAFPGAYSADDAGILYDAYTAQTYTVPGPSLFTCSGSSSSSSSSGSSSNSASNTGGAAAATTLSTVTRASSAAATTSNVAATTDAAVAAPTASSSDDSSDDDDSCAEETVTSTVSAVQAQATTGSASGSASDDGEDDGCDAEDDGSSSSTTGAASGSDSSSSSGSDSSSSSSGSTSSGSDSSSSSSSSSSGSTSSGDDSEDDGCDAEGEEPTATGSGSQAQSTGSAAASGSDYEADDCDAEEEQAYASRFRARGAGLYL